MGRTIEFDVEQLIGKLNIIERSQLGYVGNRALKVLGFQIRENLRQNMASTFNNPVPFTLNSPRYKVEGLNLTVYLNPDGAKGQDPARYLYPVSTEDTTGSKPAYVTRFNRALQANGIINSSYFAIPYMGGRGVAKDGNGNMARHQYATTLLGLKNRTAQKSGKGKGDRYISVPDNRSTGRANRAGTAKPGIYRIKDNQFDMLFGYLRSVPNVPTKFDYQGITTRTTDTVLPSLLSQLLNEALSR